MYIIAIDQGTTGTTCVLLDANTFKIIDKHNIEHRQIYLKPGLVEHDLNEIWQSTLSSINLCLKNNNVDPHKIKCIGITNQRETTCAFTKDGVPLSNAIVWQDRRTESFCESLDKAGHSESIKKKTGLPIDAYFSASKMHWLLENNLEVKSALNTKTLLFGNIDTYLLYRLTGNKVHATDASNASRTMLMNLDTQSWDQELLDIFKVSASTLPEIKDSIGVFGYTKGLDILPDGIAISGILGDQQSALFGQACFHEGGMKCTYGTGAFLLLNTGTQKKYSSNGLLTTVAYKHKNETYYALEGSTYIAGACVQYLRDNLKFFSSAREIEPLAESATLTNTKDVFFLPFFTGIGSPYWISNAKASILGLTRDSGSKEISRAALEGIAFSINDLIGAMGRDLNKPLTNLKVDGGAVSNNLLMQIQANISDVEVIRPEVIETTAYGAALAAAIGVGLTTKEKLSQMWEKDKSFIKVNDSETTDYFNYKKAKWSHYIKALYIS